MCVSQSDLKFSSGWLFDAFRISDSASASSDNRFIQLVSCHWHGSENTANLVNCKAKQRFNGAILAKSEAINKEQFIWQTGENDLTCS